MPEYYDYVLGLIPLTLFGLTGGLLQTSLALTQALPIAAAVTIGIIGHALFIRPPNGSRAGRRSSENRSTGQFQNAD
ncbi:hypothetical protein [Halobellus rarus]|uniref:Uncharacterized protein n=1 Tax=Halobellus rarus TaxID=1126237 RepID=A0ABD6CPX4_9EURY|nr:hypothetical protein [Halobellus rarus]